jgi:hypothetical protein
MAAIAMCCENRSPQRRLVQRLLLLAEAAAGTADRCAGYRRCYESDPAVAEMRREQEAPLWKFVHWAIWA